ncbi:hypothetical protein GF339_15290 [candidate division KSB3 bacterium]|uniref:Uncharacterized protein n=1 Tax=candidate division KSB3 bacterium TaxID=2044937 RepID=A0A9D5Q6M8_9BACT|nr:hypothetical protein [candidate division KSB3 bacterium]MBD3325950.1 hypothetical protein [candidate division KSB3 bacterium]
MTGFSTWSQASKLIVLVLAVVLVFVGCGDSDNDSPTATTSASPTESVPPNAILSESLQDGQTDGTINAATFTDEGLHLFGGDGFITYSIPTTSAGYAEFSAKGFVQDELYGGTEFKAALFTMWSGNDGYDYANAPFILEVRKFGYIEGRPDASNCLTVRVKSQGVWEHGHFNIVGWDPSVNYRFRIEWGGGEVRVYRDGQLITSEMYIDPFAPSNHQVQIGAQPRGRKEGPHDIVISDVVIGTL